MDQATCIECGCDDNHACRPDGCFWLRVDYHMGLGVCSQCGSRVADWDRGHPTPSETAARKGAQKFGHLDAKQVPSGDDSPSDTVWQPLTDTNHPAVGDHCLVAYARMSQDGIGYQIIDCIVKEMGIPEHLDDFYAGYDSRSLAVAWCLIPPVDINIASAVEIIEVVMPDTGFHDTFIVPCGKIPSYYAIGSCVTIILGDPCNEKPTDVQIIEARFVGYHNDMRHHRIVVDWTQATKKAKTSAQSATRRQKEKREAARAALTLWGIEPDTSDLEQIVDAHRALLGRHGALETIESKISWRRGHIQTETAALYRDGMTEEEMRNKAETVSRALKDEIRHYIERRIAEAQSLDHYCDLYQRFVQEHGHGDVPVGYIAPDGKELGIWIKNIRSLRKTNTQTKRLVEMGILPNPDDHP